jgi:hypothetical protein
MLLVKYAEGVTFFADIDLGEWENKLGDWEYWKKTNGWVPASPQEKLRSAMVEPIYRVKTTYEGRTITMWAVA